MYNIEYDLLTLPITAVTSKGMQTGITQQFIMKQLSAGAISYSKDTVLTYIVTYTKLVKHMHSVHNYFLIKNFIR